MVGDDEPPRSSKPSVKTDSLGEAKGGDMISINGKVFGHGNNICIQNGKVIIDGVVSESSEKVINITIDGDVDTLDVDCANQISITGNVKKVKTQTGDVDISGNVEGNVETQTGDVDIEGSVSGDVDTTTGDIKYRR